MKIATFFAILFVAFCAQNCSKSATKSAAFNMLNEDETGLHFQNKLIQNTTFNALNYMYFYNGGGVAAGDFNQDGLVDLYFTNNMGENKLFLNKGGMHFEDITEAAGVSGCSEAGCGWTTGASVVDINDDGMLDIYVSKMGDFESIKGQNQLFICKSIENGVPVFEDQAIQYGLDLVGFGTQAVFFDYDLDGDLDMFQLNHSVHANGTFGQKKTFAGTYHPLAGDKMMRNDGGKFTNVTEKSGINSSVIGYGLGVAAGDINMDGWPDLYIGNDFHENDYLYINQKNGTFKEVLTAEIRHTSQFSMGVDIGDVNNDGLSDIFTLDMLPEDPFILKSSLGEDEYSIYHFKQTYGYNHQFARNTLQKNNGDGTFTELGMFAGVYATDWSWCTFFADFDDDGRKDIFVSNGIERRMNDIDYANFRMESDVRFKANSNNLEEGDLSMVEKMPRVKLKNKFFHNQGNFKFEDLEMKMENNIESFSNGAIYADLDNDGDLDIVVNNLEDAPFVYQNNRPALPENSYLQLDLHGPQGNRNAIGSKVLVYKGNERILSEKFPVRGYQSSAIGDLHIGVGESSAIDSVLIIWPDNSYEHITQPAFNKRMVVSWRTGLPVFNYSQLQPAKSALQFEDITASLGLKHQHTENPFVEFDREMLMPWMVSSEGPAITTGDLNGDGLADLFVGSCKRRKSVVFFQNTDGTFVDRTPAAIANDSLFEDVDAQIIDLDNDGDSDLAIAAGGNEYRNKEEALQQHFYRNDGNGNFTRINLEGIFMTASCVLPGDFNNDGLVDLFLGARALPWSYGITPESALLLNKGNGQFENVIDQVAPELKNAGLVKGGTWTDMDGDGNIDLLLAIEWEPVTLFKNNGKTLAKSTINSLSGWWNFVLPFDYDGDGDLDIIAGNTGMNSKLKPTKTAPVRMYVSDFDNNGQVEQILTYYVKGREIPFANHKEMMKALPMLKKKFLKSQDFARASISELFGSEALKKAVYREVNTSASMYFENTGNGQFTAHELPDELQWSTLNVACQADLKKNGQQELLLGGNFYDCNIEMGRYDANMGNVLSFVDGVPKVSLLGDIRLDGQVRHIRPLQTKNGAVWVFGMNNQDLRVLRVK